MASNTQLRDEAVECLKATEITYPMYEDRVNNGYRGKPYVKSKTKWGQAFDKLAQITDVAAPPIPVPPDPTPTPSNLVLDAFEIVMEPGNHEDTPGNNRYSFGWTEWTSPVTPKAMPNGEPPGRGLRKGERYFCLKGYCFKSDEGCGRVQNRHAWAVPGVGWEGEVSPMALDCYDAGYMSKSGASFEVNFEYERAQDTHDTEPHSGGMSVALPAYMAARNVWIWQLEDLLLDNGGRGIYRMWDWVTGQLVINLQGINTLSDRNTGTQGWEGGYNSSGVDRQARCLQTPGLYAKYTDGPLAVLLDKPKLVKAWHSVSTGGGPSSQVNLGVQKVTVPAGKVKI